MSSAAFGKTITIDFGDLGKMPWAWDAPAGDALTFNEAVFGRLIRVDADFGLAPELLERFHFDRERGGFVLKIKSGLRFGNGRAVDARDLEFSILRGFFSDKPNFFGVYLGNIDGVETIKAGTAYRGGLVRGVSVLSEDTLLVKLKTPNPSFLHSLANLLVRLVPREELKADLVSWKTKPIGAGAYRIKSVDAKKFEVRVEPKSGGAPDFVLRYGGVRRKPDISVPTVEGFERVVYARPTSVSALFFSNRAPLAKDRSFRQALASVIERKSYVQGNMSEARELLPPTFWGRATPTDAFTAKTFAGQKVSARILSLKAPAGEMKERLRATLTAALVKLKAEPRVDFTAAKFMDAEGDRDAVVYGFSMLANYFDPLIMFNSFGPQSPLTNVDLRADAVFMDLFRKASDAPDFQARMETMRELSRYLVHEAYAIPLGYDYDQFFYDTKTITSVGTVETPQLIHLDQVVAR